VCSPQKTLMCEEAYVKRSGCGGGTWRQRILAWLLLYCGAELHTYYEYSIFFSMLATFAVAKVHDELFYPPLLGDNGSRTASARRQVIDNRAGPHRAHCIGVAY